MTAVALLLLTGFEVSSGKFRPPQVPYADLLGGASQDEVEVALTEVGMLVVTDVPGLPELHRSTMASALECLEALPEDEARGHVFEDGTARRTLALTTQQHGLELASPACAALAATQGQFRGLVGDAAAAFARRLDALLALGGAPLLASSTGAPYADVEEVFARGEHLEHVHAYRASRSTGEPEQQTMDFHTDQGLCIVFTPALMIQERAAPGAGDDPSDAGRFQVQLAGGEREDVELRSGELVFMLGDGVNQILNPRRSLGQPLRAVPHALSMPAHAASAWRLWYGRMFVAPADAISDEHSETYGELRDMMTEAWVTESAEFEGQLRLGCSSGLRARELNEASDDPPCSSGARRRCSGSCANHQKQCWWRCMNFTEVESECAAKDMTYNCTNRRDEISIGGLHHGDYDLRCTDKSNTQLVRGNCELSQINADRPSTCGSAGFEEFLRSECGDFAGRHDLLLDEQGQPEVVFMWSISGGKVSGALSFNGKAAWLAMGIENIGGGKNGMQGGKVVLGISSHDTEFPNHTGTVQEYRIHDSESRFRMWNTAYEASAIGETEIVEENCYMTMKFTTDSIFGESLNISSGSNRLIWALRASTYMQIGKDSYHEGCSGENRTRYRGGGAESPWIIDFSNTTRSAQDTNLADSTSLSTPLSTSLSSDETASSSSRLEAQFAVALAVAMAVSSLGSK